ncbi:MAG: HAD family phosphatase [Treponema sp.]|nr:HAD family phosphatase [Treponema sp.]
MTGRRTPCMPKGVILDMDGLMLDTERLEIGAFIRVCEEMAQPISEAMLRSTIGITDDAAEELYLAEYGRNYPYREIWNRTRRRITELGERGGIPHRPGLLALLDHLGRLGIPLAVATSANRERARWKLEKAGILERFRFLACGDEVAASKPAPDVFLLALERLGEQAEDCVGFEDSPAGLKALAAAGIPSVFVKDQAEPSKEVLSTVWRRCADLTEAAELFG